MSDFMRSSDAFTWAMETDPALRSTIVTLTLLDRAPDWDEVVDRFERLCRNLPIFRQRVVPSLPPAPPRWEDDQHFDLGFHMRRVSAPAPGDLNALLEMARIAAMSDFDRARPLWEVTLIDDLADGGAALLAKLHHSLTDGIGGVQIAMSLLDVAETPQDRGPMPPERKTKPPLPFDVVIDTLRYNAELAGMAASASVKTVPEMILHGVRRPVQTVRSAGAVAASVYRTVRPIANTGSSLMARREPVRHLAVHQVSLPSLRKAGHLGGGSVNDAFLAGVTGGLRRYHEKHGISVGDLHMTMPVSIRAEGEAMGGNRITLMRYDLPVGLADPRQRIREIHKRATKQRNEKSLPYTNSSRGR